VARSKALRLEDYLAHIIEAVVRIERYTKGMDQDGFLASEITQDAVLRNLGNIGEASRNILAVAPEFSAAPADFPLKAAYGMRNYLSHGYHDVNLEVAWSTVMGDLPELKVRAETALVEILGR